MRAWLLLSLLIVENAERFNFIFVNCGGVNLSLIYAESCNNVQQSVILMKKLSVIIVEQVKVGKIFRKKGMIIKFDFNFKKRSSLI